MATERPTPEYNCTIAQLYVIARTGWNSHNENLPLFSDFSTNYTAANFADAMQQIDNAVALPMFQARNEATETTYVQMRFAAKSAMKYWRYLRNHIRASYPKDERKAKWESAGKDKYDKAANNNWSELLVMLQSGKNFITNNSTTLATGGMPATFPQIYNDAMDAFALLYDQFLDFEQDEMEGTDEKVLANNAVYRRLMDMFEDGQLVCEELPAKYDRFVFQKVKDTVTQPSGGGTPATELYVRGLVIDVSTSAPQPNVPVSVTLLLPTGPQQTTVTANEMGLFVFEAKELPPNADFDMVIGVNVPGFAPYSNTVPVSSGERFEENIELTPMVPPPPPPPPPPPVEP